MTYKYLFHFYCLISWTIFIYYFYWSVIYHIELKDQQGKQHLDSTTPSIPCGLEANVTLNNWNKKKSKNKLRFRIPITTFQLFPKTPNETYFQ